MQARTCIDYLKRAGYKVVHAADGEQALWLYRRETPDLILMDVIMPKMSGFEVAKKIREEDFSTPILFISSLTHSQHAIDGFDLGANDYIRKEVLLDEVVVSPPTASGRWSGTSFLLPSSLPCLRQGCSTGAGTLFFTDRFPLFSGAGNFFELFSNLGERNRRELYYRR